MTPEQGMMPPLPEGDRFIDTLKFRRLGTGGGDVLYECWGDAIKAYGAACAAAERERIARVIETRPTYGDPVQGWLDLLAAAIRAMPAPEPSTPSPDR